MHGGLRPLRGLNPPYNEPKLPARTSRAIAMQTVSFNCPHCQKMIGVSLALVGLEVQCPSCGAAVVAPASAEPFVSFDEPAGGSSESHESIFGEHLDEDVFGSRAPRVELP